MEDSDVKVTVFTVKDRSGIELIHSIIESEIRCGSTVVLRETEADCGSIAISISPLLLRQINSVATKL